MKIQIVLTLLLLTTAGSLYAAEVPQPVPFDLEHLPDPAFVSLAQSLPYETLISLRSTSRTFRNKLRDPKFADLFPTKLIEYWSQPLVYVSTAPKNPKKHQHIMSIQFSPNGKYVATGNLYGIFLLWQLETQTSIMVQNIKVVEKKAKKIRKWNKQDLHIDWFNFYRTASTSATAFSPDGKIIAGAFLENIFLWDVIKGKIIYQLHDENNISSIAFSPKGQLLAYNNRYFVKLVSTSTYEIKQEIKSSIPPLLAFSPDGSMLACTGISENPIASDTITLWSIADTGDNREKIGEFKNAARVESIAFSPDGATLAIGLHNGTLNIWNIKIGPDGKLAETDKPTTVLSGLKRGAAFLAFSRYGAILASSTYGAENDNKIILWDLRTGQQITELKGHGPIAFSPDGLLLAAHGLDGYMGLWQQAKKFP